MGFVKFLFIFFFFWKLSKVQSFGYQNCVMWQFNATSQMVNNISGLNVICYGA